MFEATIAPTFESWRESARVALRAGIEPANVLWTDGDAPALPMLAQPLETAVAKGSSTAELTISRAFLSKAQAVSMHRDAERWGLLYRVLFRLKHGEPRLLDNPVDDDVHRLQEMEASVRRDLHKMHAFVRFRRIDAADGNAEQYVAFHRPDHLIVPAAAPWFARRFAVMRWTILTPDASASWDGSALAYGPGVAASPVSGDELEELWRVYYGNIFNPARIKIRAMKKEMPVRHWDTLPETAIIGKLLKEAPGRVEAMIQHSRPAADAGSNPIAESAAALVPKGASLTVLREAAMGCRGCGLCEAATQTVFGKGPERAVAMFVGEQPGDQEDLAGEPFVGPAGQLLDRAFAEAGIARERCYITNAVKHFKFIQRGKRRIHSKPSAREIHACRPWLSAEVELIQPQIIVALGATAAQTMLGPQFRLTENRGKVFSDTRWAPWFMATVHPSFLLRIPDSAQREVAFARFVADLQFAAKQFAAISDKS